MKNMFLLLIIAIAGFYFLSGRNNNNDVTYQNITPNQAKELLKQDNYILLDVRTPAEISERSISGSLNIPLQEIEQRLDEIPRDQHLLVICRSGNRSRQAISILHKHGYTKLYNVDGGISAWKK